MKVCIPCTDATGEQARLSIPYGQAPFFALWDAATDQLEFQSNPLAGQDHACACATTHWMQRIEASVLITADIGRRAAQRLTKAGIEVLHAPADNLGELLERYRDGSLVPAPAGEPRWLRHGSRHTEYQAQRHAAHSHGGEGHCGRDHEGQHAQGHHGLGGHHSHCGKGKCGGEHEGQHGRGHHGQGVHGGGCCHSA